MLYVLSNRGGVSFKSGFLPSAPPAPVSSQLPWAYNSAGAGFLATLPLACNSAGAGFLATLPLVRNSAAAGFLTTLPTPETRQHSSAPSQLHLDL
jgi:hypothetical protein